MQIGGLVKLSLIDYPGKTAAVVFTQGCNFRCPYCHNKELVIPACFKENISPAEIISFLLKRQGLLQGVVISGGEPTLQKDLIPFLKEIRSLGFSIKLDTNGTRPDVLKDLIQQNLIHFIAMDIKASLERYHLLSGVPVDLDVIQQSISLIKNSGLDHQFRTTVVRSLMVTDDFTKMAELIVGAKSYIFQNFTSKGNLIDSSLADSLVFSELEFNSLKEKWEKLEGVKP